MSMVKKIRPIAIYLPQFHPIPENDEWWGRGFTEWRNVARAKPLFRAHYQPHFPEALGYYDLRSEETRLAQEALAKKHGFHGFCYYHYWFNGKKLLNEVVERKLNNPKEDFPFMFCWANETWSRRWLGEEKEILIEQTYSEEDDFAHIRYLIGFFKDPRYIKVNGHPVFVIYRPTFIPHLRTTLKIFKDECIKEGLPAPYFIASNSHSGYENLYDLGFDNILNFSPKLGALPGAFNDGFSKEKFFNNIKYSILSPFLKVYDYQEAKISMRWKYDYSYLPCCFVGWDNTPRRREKGVIIINQKLDVFLDDLKYEIDKLLGLQKSSEENFVFINAWNEWAEGNHLEPCRRFGDTFLAGIGKLFNGYNH